MDNAALADGSGHSEGHYRALGAGSVPAGDVVFLTERLEHALQLDSYGELKPKNIRRAGSRNRAVAAVDVLLAHVATGVPLDVLTWDTHDDRPTDRQRIATWFLDTDYDGHTFCICQPFFPDKSKWSKLARRVFTEEGAT